MGVVFVFSGAQFCLANNIDVYNVVFKPDSIGEYGSNTAAINFDLKWENSWYDSPASGEMGSMGGHDAAWVFIKYSINGGQTWQHGKLAASGINPPDFLVGQSYLRINVPSDSGDQYGCFVERIQGSGTVDTSGVRLIWNYSPQSETEIMSENLRIKVFAIEMAYIPGGEFYFGDRIGAPLDPGAHGVAPVAWNTESIPLKVWDDPTYGILPYEYGGNGLNLGYAWLRYVLNWGGNPNLAGGWSHWSVWWPEDFPSAYPRGYYPFYMMKYEVSQKQYCDFLNLNYVQAPNFYPGYNKDIRYFIKELESDGWSYGYGCDQDDDNILNENVDGQWVALFNTSHNDAAGYLDWSCLRFMSEFEFEKACRGVQASFPAVEGTYIWGDKTTQPQFPNGFQVGTINTADEMPSNQANINYNEVGGINTPLRVGAIAAKGSQYGNTQETTGGGWYGVMDLIGNVGERLISISNFPIVFDGTHGNGDINPPVSWDGINSNSRGYSYVDTAAPYQKLAVSCRVDVGASTSPATRYLKNGFRGVRIFP